jgi:hypothetical protein
MHKAESSSASNRCTRLIAFIARKRSVSKKLPPLSGFRLTPWCFHTNRDIRGITLVLIQLHPGRFCSQISGIARALRIVKGSVSTINEQVHSVAFAGTFTIVATSPSPPTCSGTFLHHTENG